MILFTTHLRVNAQNAPAFEALMSDVAGKVHAHEPDVLFYDFARSVDDPDTYVVVEVYRDVAAQEKHMTAEWVTGSLPKAASLVEGGFDIKQYVSPGAEPVRHMLVPDS